jgi:16S rRNA A1518/A1519 N6-dimethyltransferase RsmA/KsgA/DIM1 with predicted DNA glycosylase/AP lyase activity
MNRLHRWYCQSSQWKQKLENKILPWSLGGVDLGDEVLEVGPGPGLTTDWLRHRCKNITCIEVDPQLANTLNHRVASTNVSVQCGWFVNTVVSVLPIPTLSSSYFPRFVVKH